MLTASASSDGSQLIPGELSACFWVDWKVFGDVRNLLVFPGGSLKVLA